MQSKFFWRILLLSFVAVFASSCSVTVGATEGTSESFENTTDSAGDFSKASTKFTSSTSPRGDDDDDDDRGPASTDEARKKAAREFAEKNYDSLRRDVAHGGGEYLAAVADILAVETEQRPEYYSMSKTMFLSLTSNSGGTPDRLADKLFQLSKTLQS